MKEKNNAHIISKLKHLFIRFTVKRKLRIILLIQTAIFAMVSLYLIVSSVMNVLNQYKNADRNFMAGYALKISAALKQMEEISLFPIQPLSTGQYQEVYSYLAEGATFVGNYSFSNAFYEKAKSYLDITQGFDLIAMYDSSKKGLYCWDGDAVYNGTYCVLAENNPQWYQNTLENKGGAVIIPISDFTGSGIPSADGETLCVARSVTHIGRYESIGVLVLGISSDALEHEFETLRASQEEDFLLLYDNQCIAGNEQLLGEEQKTILDGLLQDGKHTRYILQDSSLFMVNYYRFDENLSIATKTPLSYILSGVPSGNLPLILFLFLLLLLMFLFTFFATSSINHSVYLLVEVCAEMENGEFSSSSLPKDEMSGEFGILFSAFHRMAAKINHLVNEILQRDLEKKNIELYALRSQINSHYLYNTLESIRMKAYTQKSYDLAEMAMLLGSNLQYNLKEIDDEVTIREEIESVRNYIRLIQLNYTSGICFSVNVDEKIMQYSVMKFILQPIIENTIAHAFGAPPQTLQIDIMGYSMGEDIILSVADDGKGIPAKRLAEVRKALQGEPSKCRRIGLKNINRRIKLFYGDGYGVEIKSTESVGTVTSIRIPAVKDRKDSHVPNFSS